MATRAIKKVQTGCRHLCASVPNQSVSAGLKPLPDFLPRVAETFPDKCIFLFRWKGKRLQLPNQHLACQTVSGKGPHPRQQLLDRIFYTKKQTNSEFEQG